MNQNDDYATVATAIETAKKVDAAGLTSYDIAKWMGTTTSKLEQVLMRWGNLSLEGFFYSRQKEYRLSLLDMPKPELHSSADKTKMTDVGLSVHAEVVDRKSLKKNGVQLDLAYGFSRTPFGEAVVLSSERGLIALGWVEKGSPAEYRSNPINYIDTFKTWPDMVFSRNDQQAEKVCEQIFQRNVPYSQTSLPVLLIGSEFETSVWNCLLSLPTQFATTYGNVAEWMAKPKAVQPVAGAVCKNPLGFVIANHRVFAKGAVLSGYHWGEVRQQAILSWESGRMSSASKG